MGPFLGSKKASWCCCSSLGGLAAPPSSARVPAGWDGAAPHIPDPTNVKRVSVGPLGHPKMCGQLRPHLKLCSWGAAERSQKPKIPKYKGPKKQRSQKPNPAPSNPSPELGRSHCSSLKPHMGRVNKAGIKREFSKAVNSKQTPHGSGNLPGWGSAQEHSPGICCSKPLGSGQGEGGDGSSGTPKIPAWVGSSCWTLLGCHLCPVADYFGRNNWNVNGHTDPKSIKINPAMNAFISNP